MSENKSKLETDKSYLNSILLSEETLPVSISAKNVNLSELCRTCLCNASANDLNNKTLCIVTGNGKLLPLYHLFEVATGHKFDFNSTLPHRLCHTCLELLNTSYMIRTQSQRAEDIIKCAKLVRNEVGTTPTLVDIETNMNTIQVEGELNTENIETQNQMNDRAFDKMDHNRQFLPNERVGNESSSSVIFIIPSDGKVKEKSTINEDPAKCMFCQKSFPNHIQVLLHYNTCPEDLEPDPRNQSEVRARCFKVPDKPKKKVGERTNLQDQRQNCMRAAKSKSQSEADTMTSHKGQYHCPNCEQKFLQVTELREHVLTHTNNDIDEFYYCMQCAKQWKTQQGWILHMNQHKIEEDKRNRQLSE